MASSSTKILSPLLLLLLLNIISLTCVTCTKHSPCAPPDHDHEQPPKDDVPKSSPPGAKCPCDEPKSPKAPESPKSSPSRDKCPKDMLKLGACADVMRGLINMAMGKHDDKCCSVLGDMAGMEAAMCLCTAVKAGVMGINLDMPVDLSLLVNNCGKKMESGFQCA